MMRIPQGLMPAHDSDREKLKAIPHGKPVRVKVTQVRNYEFLKKYFALLNYAYEVWEPLEPKASKLLSIIDMQPQKSFDCFRSDVIILAGYYTATYRLNGDIKLEPKSIAFGNMTEDEFEELFSKTIDVIIKHVLNSYNGDMLRNIIEQVEAFDS